ncbi:g-type lectin s-receptor-like serine/threonine-protein kinase lecrk3 [Quercus suber]|uniref:G-type lectin s-receptor-like serine/threonine-protein kinase lecrk3 n=1 Tax=Quercus suber TaxID=58331 RepID=A0AAW0JXS5_QUESU
MATSTHPQFCCLLLLLLLLPLLPTVFTTYTKDDCNKWLQIPSFVAKPGTGILSPSGKFIFGFHPLESSEKVNQFLLAVWFNKTKDPTIVWSTNGNKPAPEGSELKLSSNKESHQSETNYSDGRFEVALQLDGNFVLYYLWSEKIKGPYFATMTMQCISVLNFTEDGRMYILDENNSYIYSLTEKNPGSRESFYHMARIDPDGGFRLYSLPRKENPTSDGLESCSSSSWNEVQSIPDDTCGRFDANFFVGGLCGLNGICRTSDESSGNGKAFCTCPSGFSPLDPSNGWAGCKPNFPLPSCDNGWEANKGSVTFAELPKVDWPLSADYSLLQGVSEAECKQQCLDNCMCVVTVHDKQMIHVGRSILCPMEDTVKMLRERLSSRPWFREERQSVVVVLALLLGSSAFLNILFFSASIVAIIYLYHKRLNSRWNIHSTLATNVRSYTYKELDEATRGFKQTVGKGAFGTLIENDEEARNDMKRLERLVIVAIWCIQEDPSLRPSMKKVTQMLEGEGVIEVSVPPSPSLFTSSPPSFKK